MVLHYLLQSRGVYTVLLYIFIKQRHVQTFWGIIHVCQAILETGSGRQLSQNGCTAGNFDLPDHGFLFLTWSTGPMEWSTGNSYQAEALTNVLRYHTCRSSLREDRKLSITELKWDARTVTDIPGNNAYWFIKQRHVQTFWGIIHVCQAILETGSGRQLSHNGCTAAILTYPTMFFYFLLGPQVLWNDLRGIVIKQRHWQTFWGIIHVDQAFVRTRNCLLRS